MGVLNGIIVLLSRGRLETHTKVVRAHLKRSKDVRGPESKAQESSDLDTISHNSQKISYLSPTNTFSKLS